ncbi:Uncharacterized protein FKW44_020884 [Caligus rogercresseyi]|uniref:Uncharacterized protein n=1 Tax=Caligus rogercresseyi TaxID=217165 RepID=A0A7T8JVD4_CALRO|nr:Uncharacterized protein FKW44_020884 [Caligus rogercresseyi]
MRICFTSSPSRDFFTPDPILLSMPVALTLYTVGLLMPNCLEISVGVFPASRSGWTQIQTSRS